MKDLNDVLTCLGAALISLGAGVISVAVGLIVAGLCLIGIAFLADRRSSKGVA